MYISTTLFAAALLFPSTLAQATFQRSSKRGLVFVPSTKYPQDNQIWVESGSDLTWYYNYGATPSSAYSNRTQAEFEFVPMLWGAPTSTSDNTFLTGVKQLISDGTNISHVLTFNEPDGTASSGGSNVDPTTAATTWIREIEPLRKLGVKTGAPAVTGSQGGFTWLSEFFSACTSQGTNCTADFIPIHWYGDFQGLASHIGQVVGTYVYPPSPSHPFFIPLLTLYHADTPIHPSGSPSTHSTTPPSPTAKPSSTSQPTTSTTSSHIVNAIHTSALSDLPSRTWGQMLRCWIRRDD